MDGAPSRERKAPNPLSGLRTLAPADLLFAVGAIAALLTTFPWGGTTPADDDWDFIADVFTKPFIQVVLTPSNGHFLPLHRALYGATLLSTGFSFLAAAANQHVIRLGILLCLRALLRATGSWSIASALLILATAFHQAGLEGGFRWPWSTGLELSLLGFVVAVFFAIKTVRNPRSFLAMGAGCAVSILSFNLGVGATLGIPIALLLGHFRDPRAVPRRRIAMAAAILFFLDGVWLMGGGGRGSAATVHETASAPAGPLSQGREATRYFAYLTLANSTPSGLVTNVSPGTANAAFALLLFAGSIGISLKSANLERAMTAGMFLAGHIAVNLLIALGRWPYGIQHSGSYRYVCLNIFFQLTLMCLCLAEARDRVQAPWMRVVSLGLGLTVVSVACLGGLRGLVRSQEQERRQAVCLQTVIEDATDLSCLAHTSGYQKLERVRELWRTVRSLQ